MLEISKTYLLEQFEFLKELDQLVNEKSSPQQNKVLMNIIKNSHPNIKIHPIHDLPSYIERTNLYTNIGI